MGDSFHQLEDLVSPFFDLGLGIDIFSALLLFVVSLPLFDLDDLLNVGPSVVAGGSGVASVVMAGGACVVVSGGGASVVVVVSGGGITAGQKSGDAGVSSP